MPPSPRTPTANETKALKTASATEGGRLPDTLTRRMLASLLDAGYICREGTDSARADDQADLAALDAGPAAWRITDRGRRAVLTDAQWRALTERVAPDDALLPNVNWVTKQALHDLGLVEYRDDTGRIQSTDGSTGLRGPIHRAFRTGTGRRLAASEPASP
ncbi:hypothetical protein [Streptomyces sp. bgisy154]|uniref:hypothetical protein n=1 Tax=Streptomyces sp. bgisy154 TaxID=3413794 RepID=UPI003D71A935